MRKRVWAHNTCEHVSIASVQSSLNNARQWKVEEALTGVAKHRKRNAASETFGTPYVPTRYHSYCTVKLLCSNQPREMYIIGANAQFHTLMQYKTDILSSDAYYIGCCNDQFFLYEDYDTVQKKPVMLSTQAGALLFHYGRGA